MIFYQSLASMKVIPIWRRNFVNVFSKRPPRVWKLPHSFPERAFKSESTWECGFSNVVLMLSIISSSTATGRSDSSGNLTVMKFENCSRARSCLECYVLNDK